MKGYKKYIILLLMATVLSCSNKKQVYEPTFESLEKVNPVPEWFQDAKFGIYFHWGVYTVPAFANEWYPRNMYIDGSIENQHHKKVYGDPLDWPYSNFITGAKDKAGNFKQFAPKLKSEGGQFDPEEWAQLFADAGAKFAGPVAEHHDGFSMWASEANPWNAKDQGPGMDLVGLLSNSIRKHDMKVILSMHHAFNITGFFEAAPYSDDTTLQILYGQQGKEKNEALWLVKHKEIIDNYQPDIIWQDFNLHIISQPVLLEFLSYYYNKANEWNKEVVATYKDGLNSKCAVLDFERGGAQDVTPYYWLTDDAISSTSWCYTEGLEYYSKKQILHGFLDRISKNGNLLLNISPKSDGSIPQGQKDILLAMGNWLKKYGESVYATRAWKIYGEGPTKMGAGHGVFTEPEEGTSKDIRFTRSKDNKTLYAILMGWDENQKEITINSLSSDRVDLKNLKTVNLINGENNKYQKLSFKQSEKGLTIELPEKTFEEMAYVLKLGFKDQVPSPDRYADINCDPYFLIQPAFDRELKILSYDLKLTDQRKKMANQWKLESLGKGFYRILNRENSNKAIICISDENSVQNVVVSEIKGNDNEIWKIEDAYNGYLFWNKNFPGYFLSMNNDETSGKKAGLVTKNTEPQYGWTLKEVCELKQEPFKQNTIPGIIEAEDFDKGCLGDAFFERDETNSGGKYRPDEPVDIDTCMIGGYAVGWTNRGEWLAYTVNVKKTSSFKVEFYVASPSDQSKIYLEYDGENITGDINLPQTGGYQNWKAVEKIVKMEAGKHVLKLMINNAGFNIDKIVFKETK